MNTSVIISGFGGQGALFAGMLLCHTAMKENKFTTWIPAYGAEMRGGAVNCSVNISDKEIPSPVIDKADVVIALNNNSLVKFENKVKSGGVMIINSSLAFSPTTRNDIEYIKIPFNELGQTIQQPAFVNVMALGAFIEKTGILKLDSLIESMKDMSTKVSKKKAALLPNNIESAKLGAQAIKKQMVSI